MSSLLNLLQQRQKGERCPWRLPIIQKYTFHLLWIPVWRWSRNKSKEKDINCLRRWGARTRTRQNVNLCYLVWPKATTIIAQALEFAIKFLDPHSSNVLHERIKRHGHNLYAVRLCPWTHNLGFHFRNLLKMGCVGPDGLLFCTPHNSSQAIWKGEKKPKRLLPLKF